MRTIKPLIFLLLFLNIGSLSLMAQKDFNTFYRANNPALGDMDADVKKKLHQEFLDQALQKEDTLKIILGSMYLANDLVKETDYSAAMENLIRAGQYAAAKKDTLLTGRVNHKKGAIYSILKKYRKAISYYETSLSESVIAKDSQYIAITLEQLGRRYANLQEFEKSNSYYQKAIPLVEKFCPPNSYTTTLINYGNSLCDQDSTVKAIQTYKKSISISEQIPDDYETIPAKQNLALTYTIVDSLDKALELYQECRRVNEENGWLDFLIYSYEGLSITYDLMGETDSAFYYFKKFYSLKEEVLGTQVQSRVNQLESENEKQKNELALIRQREQAEKQRQSKRNTIFLSLLFQALSILGLGWLFIREKRIKQQLKENRRSLRDLTKVLESKNAALRDLKSQLPKTEDNPEQVSVDNFNFYDMSILKDSDWEAFKMAFEKSYPKYLQKLRHTYPDISVAEERLFVFIKLQLSTIESANILGVQAETIKKTRSRLRKRLGLGKSKNLNDFVRDF